MNAPWLAQLAPDRVPPAVGWWPPALGWWALLLIVALLAAMLCVAWRNPQRRRQRIALRKLARIRADSTDPIATAQALQDLLRRYAIAVCGRDRIARLSGTAWLALLREHGGLDDDAGQSLLRAAYGSHPETWREPWLLAAAQFIRRLKPAHAPAAAPEARAT